MPADPHRVKELLVAALEFADPQARPSLLDRECAGDADLRRRLDELLHAPDHPESVLERLLAAAADPGTQSFHPNDIPTSDLPAPAVVRIFDATPLPEAGK